MNGPGRHEVSGPEMKFLPVCTVAYFSLDTVSCECRLRVNEISE